jgi:hypothetical protein
MEEEVRDHFAASMEDSLVMDLTSHLDLCHFATTVVKVVAP